MGGMFSDLLTVFRKTRGEVLRSGTGDSSAAVVADGANPGGAPEVLGSGQRSANVLAGVVSSKSTGDGKVSNVSVGQTILNLVESDLASVAGTPVVNFLQSLVAAKGNLLMQSAAIQQFVATAPVLGITLVVEIEQQLLQIAIVKVQAFVAAKAAAPTPAAA